MLKFIASLTDDTSIVIYNHKTFIVQATEFLQSIWSLFIKPILSGSYRQLAGFEPLILWSVVEYTTTALPMQADFN